ncbi:MAG: inositol monophosphatase [Parcubacteria group bacterium]|nr:inositol monophosphatase [Parcubacteria group bacterium]
MQESSHMEVARSLAKSAGSVIRKNFSSNMEKEWKDERSPVTVTDLLVNDMVLKELRSCYPTHSILSEEGNDCLEESEHVWICDPVDGTHNFSHGIPTATFALALVREGEPILGIIYDPFLDRMWSAEKSKGAYMNGKPISVSKHGTLKSAVIGMGKMKKVCNLFPAMEEGYGKGISFITGLSTHYMAALVAQGEFAASFFGGTPPHDMAASAIIVKEAGGFSTDLRGNVPTRYDGEMDGQLCSNGILHEELLSLLKRGEFKK